MSPHRARVAPVNASRSLLSDSVNRKSPTGVLPKYLSYGRWCTGCRCYRFTVPSLGLTWAQVMSTSQSSRRREHHRFMSGKTPNYAHRGVLVRIRTAALCRAAWRRWASGVFAALFIVVSVLPSHAHALADGSQPGPAILGSISTDSALASIDGSEPDGGQTGSDARHGHHCLPCACAHVTLPAYAPAAYGVDTDGVRFHASVLTHLASLAPLALLRPPRA